MKWVLVALASAACGRLAFESANPDASRLDVADASEVPPDADPGVVCGPGYQIVSGLASRYRMEIVEASWFEAEAACEADGGHLVTIDDGAERAYVQSLTPVETWIGYTDAVQEGTFVSVFGEPPAILAFVAPEPNNSVGVEDCVASAAVGWNDVRCALARRYICECDRRPLPTLRPWCDTDLSATCGDCRTACSGAQVCFNQVCQ